MLVTRPQFNAPLIEQDAAARGWNRATLAERAGVKPNQVSRFLLGQRQTPKTAKLLADALGRSLRRYQVPLGAIVLPVRKRVVARQSQKKAQKGRTS